MSWPERFVQDHKRQTDYAIHHACTQLASDPSAFEKFREMLTCARKRAPRLFEAPVSDWASPRCRRARQSVSIQRRAHSPSGRLGGYIIILAACGLVVGVPPYLQLQSPGISCFFVVCD